MELKQLFEEFLDDVKLFRTNGTYEFYKGTSKLMLEYFNELNITEPTAITKRHLVAYVKRCRDNGISDNTINKRILTLKTAFKKYEIKNVDVITFPKLRIEDKRYHCLSKNELAKVISYLKTSKQSLQNKCLIMMFLNTGARLLELLSVKVKDVNEAENCVLLRHTKGKKERIVFFTNEFKTQFLAPYLASTNLKPNDNLFTIAYSSVEKIFQRMRERLGIDKLSPHVLRHTLATTLVHNNCNLDVIANILGHSDIKITKRYLHQDIENTRAIYNQCFKVSLA